MFKRGAFATPFNHVVNVVLFCSYYCTVICFDRSAFLASSFLGSVSFNKPSSYRASILSRFTFSGRVKLRQKEE